MQWVKIAGRGELGDTNWGADFSQNHEEKQAWYDELVKHIGEVVALSGGGSLGSKVWFGVLKSCDWGPCGDKEAIKVRLESMTPKMAGSHVFEPWIDSWQISILSENNG